MAAVNRGAARLVASVLLVAIAAGCAALGPRGDREVVAQKAKERWDAVIAGDLKTAYGFISPAGRTVLPYEGYERGIKKGFHKAARVGEVRCTGPELCEVTLEIEYEFSGRRMKTPFFEKWVKQDAQWWYLYEK
jgi:hypothetical protein